MTFWERFSKDRTRAITVGDLYGQLDELIVWLRQEPPTVEACLEMRLTTFDCLGRCVESVTEEHTLLECQDVTLDVFTQGILSGLSQGYLVGLCQGPEGQPVADNPHLDSDQIRLLPPLISPAESLATVFTKLQNSLNRTIETAAAEWQNLATEDLELLAEYGQHQNLSTLEEAAQLFKQPAFQEFLLGTFKGGFAIGLIRSSLAHRRG